jgi:hypothetical protein
MVISMRRTSGWWMMAPAPGSEPSTGRLCTRSRAYCHGLLVGTLGHRDALHADAEARGVHHHEHVLEAAVLLADEVADRAAVVAVLQHRGGAGLDAQLVLDGDAVHVVARAQAAVGVDQALGHDEQR